MHTHTKRLVKTEQKVKLTNNEESKTIAECPWIHLNAGVRGMNDQSESVCERKREREGGYVN